MASITTQFTVYANVNRTGSLNRVWTNVSDAQTENGSGAIYPNPGSNASGYSTYLKCSDLSSSVPSGATIDGIFLRIKRGQFSSLPYTQTVKDESVFFDYLGTQSNNKADTSTNWPTLTPYVFADYGGSSDKWGLALTEAMVNSVDFSLYVALTLNSTVIPSNIANMGIDYIEVTIYYTLPVSGSRVFLIT